MGTVAQYCIKACLLFLIFLSLIQPTVMLDQDDREDPVPAYMSSDITVPDDGSIYRPDVVKAFFAAIRAKDVLLVTSLLDSNPSLAQTPSPDIPGYLPLYAATVAGNTYLVALLAQRGAPIDELSATGEYYDDYKSRHKVPVMRTPLMAAASQGSLPLVKLLFKDLEADDSVVAPDGAIALRLAVAHKHSAIVKLLPTRRNGGWRRFKHSQRKALRRIRKAGYALYRLTRFFVWDTPKFLLWTVPKFLLWELPKELLPRLGRLLWRGIKAIPRIPSAMYNLAKRFVKWLWEGIRAVPRLTLDFLRALWRVIKATPSFCLDLVKECWAALKATVKATAQWTWRLITKTIPTLIRATVTFIIERLSSAGAFILQFLKDVVSFFHTFFMAIITFFKAVTLKDVLRALKIVFVSIPKWIWQTVRDTAIAIKNGVTWTLKQMGHLVHFIVMAVWDLLIWIPTQIGQIAVGFGEIVVAGAREVALFVNPKFSGSVLE